MSEQSEADDELREVLARWCKAHERDHDGAVLGDVVAVVHFQSWGENDLQLDAYEVVNPAGVSHHAVIGLLTEGQFATESAEDDD